jgi:hypothetical protein
MVQADKLIKGIIIELCLSILCYWAYFMYALNLSSLKTKITENMDACREQENTHTQTQMKCRV